MSKIPIFAVLALLYLLDQWTGLPLLATTMVAFPFLLLEGYTRGLVLGVQSASDFVRRDGFPCLVTTALPWLAMALMQTPADERLAALRVGLPLGLALALMRSVRWRASSE